MNEDVRWTDRDDAERDFYSLPAGHPSRVVTDFHNLVKSDDVTPGDLEPFVSFHSRAGWGDFSGVRAFFMDQALAIATRALRPLGVSHVAYVKLVPDDGRYLSEKPRYDVLAYATLVWSHGWKLYGIGESIFPEHLPPASDNDPAPTYANDVQVTRD